MPIIYDIYYHRSSISYKEMWDELKNLPTQANFKIFVEVRAFFSGLSKLTVGICNCTILFLEISWQVLIFLLNCVTYMSTWLLENILRVISMLNNIAIQVCVELRELAMVVFNYTVGSLEFLWCIAGCFCGNILHFAKLSVAHFPGVILGIIIVLFSIIFILLTAYIKCMKKNQKLKFKLAIAFSRLQAERGKIKQECDENSELKSSLEKLKSRLEKLKSSLEAEMDKSLCGICEDKIKTILFLPCQHMYLCRKCLVRKKWKRCPICRQRIQSSMEVYT